MWEGPERSEVWGTGFGGVTIWKLGRTVCVYSMVQRREKEKDSRYMDETSAPAAVTVYQICNISPAQVYL
jgi:hypothetical protein